MLALIIGVMLGAIGAAVFVVTSATKHPPAQLNDTPGRRDVLGTGVFVERAEQRVCFAVPSHSAPSSTAPAYTPSSVRRQS